MSEHRYVRIPEGGSPSGFTQEVESLAKAVGRDDIRGQIAISCGEVEGRFVASFGQNLVTELLGERGDLFLKGHDDRPREELGNRRSSSAVEIVVGRAKFSLGAPVSQEGG